MSQEHYNYMGESKHGPVIIHVESPNQNQPNRALIRTKKVKEYDQKKRQLTTS